MTSILFYIETLQAGGAEKVLRTLVNNMDQSKFDITVMTLWPEEAGQYLAPGIHYQSLYRAKNRWNHAFYRLEAALGLTYRSRIHGDFDIEAAYLECGPTTVIAGSTNKKALKLDCVHCDLAIKATDVERFVRKSKAWYEKYDQVICVSENVRDSFCQLYGGQQQTIVLHNVIDENEIFQKASAFDVKKSDQTQLVAVGRLTHEKGFDILVNVCARLKQNHIPFHLQILGEGEQRQLLERMIQQQDLSDCVELLGFQSNPYPYMQAADAIVCSSRYEGFSTAVTEALTLGKPVITTPCTGMDELLGNSEYGLITENSEDGLYEGLKKMLEQPELLRHYEAQAKLRGGDFRKEHLVKQTEDFFISALGVKTKT